MKKAKSAKIKVVQAEKPNKSNLERFDTWFTKKLSEKRLEQWQKSSVLEFFKSHGLNIIEDDSQKYEKLLAKF